MGHQTEFDGALNRIADIVDGVDGAGELLVEAVHHLGDGTVAVGRSGEQLHHNTDASIHPTIDLDATAIAGPDLAVVVVVGLRNLEVHCPFALGHFDLDLLDVVEPLTVIIGDPPTIG